MKETEKDIDPKQLGHEQWFHMYIHITYILAVSVLLVSSSSPVSVYHKTLRRSEKCEESDGHVI